MKIFKDKTVVRLRIEPLKPAIPAASRTPLTAEEFNARARAEETAKLGERVDRARRLSAVQKKYQHASLDDVDLPRRILAPAEFKRYQGAAAIIRSCLTQPKTLLLIGDAGPGKTHLACALVNSFVAAGRSARYATAARFFLEMRSTFGAEGKTLVDLVDRWTRFGLLVLDEIDVRSESKWENWTLRDLITARDANELPTVMISNKSIDEVAAMFSGPVLDRIREGVVLCDWPSLRGSHTGDHANV